MNLQELINLFVPFGYTSEEVHERLSYGDSVFNTYQGLKLELELRWDEIRERTNEPALLEELEELYNRIKNIHLKSAIRVSDVRKKKAAKRKKMLAKLQQQLIDESQNRLNQYLDQMEDQRKTNPKADEFLKELEQ